MTRTRAEVARRTAFAREVVANRRDEPFELAVFERGAKPVGVCSSSMAAAVVASCCSARAA